MPQMLSIHDASDAGLWQPPAGQKTGLAPRNYAKHPIGCYSGITPYSAIDIPLMTDDAIEAAVKQKDADRSWLSDLRDIGNGGQRIPSRDQNGKGYCWAHSTVSAMLLVRARDNQPYADLSAYAIACIIKGYQDEGGWGAESCQWAIQNGCPTSKTWPQQSMSRSNDNQAMRTEAGLYRITEDWLDIQPNDNRALATLLCHDIPVVSDFNWWSHSVCACRLVSWGTNGNNLKIWIWNSWGDSWSNAGMGELAGNKASPDGMVAPRVLRAAA